MRMKLCASFIYFFKSYKFGAFLYTHLGLPFYYILRKIPAYPFIIAYPFIKFDKKVQPTRLLQPTLLLER